MDELFRRKCKLTKDGFWDVLCGRQKIEIAEDELLRTNVDMPEGVRAFDAVFHDQPAANRFKAEFRSCPYDDDGELLIHVWSCDGYWRPRWFEGCIVPKKLRDHLRGKTLWIEIEYE